MSQFWLPNWTPPLSTSAGRDKVVQVWDLSNGTIKKTIPVFEVSAGL